MSDTNQLTWEKLRRFFEVDNFGMPLPDWYGEVFDEFRETELRKARAAALREAAEAIHKPVPTLDDNLADFYADWLRDRAGKEEQG